MTFTIPEPALWSCGGFLFGVAFVVGSLWVLYRARVPKGRSR